MNKKYSGHYIYPGTSEDTSLLGRTLGRRHEALRDKQKSLDLMGLDNKALRRSELRNSLGKAALKKKKKEGRIDLGEK